MGNARTLRGASRADRAALETDREFREFVSSIAVSSEELAAMIDMPGCSAEQVSEHLRKIGPGDDDGSARGTLRTFQRRLDRGFRAFAAELATAFPSVRRERNPRMR